MIVRAMRWWDIEAVLGLERQLFAPDAWSAELFWSELAAPDRCYLVVDESGDVLAYGGLAFLGEESYVQTLGVGATAQRRGLGSRLMLELLRRAIEAGAVQCGLEVRTDNVAAQALYRAFGFAPVGLRRGYYQPSGGDALVMIAGDLAGEPYAARLDRLAAQLERV